MTHMTMTVEGLQTELAALDVRVSELQTIARTEGAGRAFPDLADAQRRRETIRAHITDLQAAQSAAAHAAYVAAGVTALDTAYMAGAPHPAAAALMQYLKTSPDVLTIVPRT
jgi:hypothetical protein